MRSTLRTAKRSLALLAAVAVAPSPAVASASETLRIWIKGFIPNAHPTNPGYVRPVPGHPGHMMIPGPASNSTCFATDDRRFSDDPAAGARLTTAFDLVLDGVVARVEKLPGRTDYSWSSATERIDCASGATVAAATAQPGVPLTGEQFHIGGPHVAESKVQVTFQASAKNPLAPPIVTPAIDYSMDLIYDKATGEVTFKATVGQFPAFEAYVARNGGKAVSLFQLMPKGDDVKWLYDFGTGIGDRSVSGTVKLASSIDGVWESTDPGRRFRLEIAGDRCRFVERDGAGHELARDVAAPATGNGAVRIERANADAELLTFLGYSAAIRQEILQRAPQPSFLILRADGGGLAGDWNGLLVIKDAQAKFKEMKQPGTTPAKVYRFAKKL